MRRSLIALLVLSIPAAASANDTSVARSFNGTVRDRESVGTIAMARPIASISSVELDGRGNATCDGVGTKTLKMRFKPTGLVGRLYEARIRCSVVLQQGASR